MEIAGEMVVKFYSLPIENLFITFFTDQSPCIQIQSVKFNVPLLYRQIYNKNILLGIKGRGGGQEWEENYLFIDFFFSDFDMFLFRKGQIDEKTIS